MGPDIKRLDIDGTEALTLYGYNEKVRSLLFQFKACGDEELGPVFIQYQAPLLKLRYRGFYLVPAPSFLAKDQARGFNHVQKIFEQLELPYIDCLRKIKDVKQATSNLEERQKIGKALSFAEGYDVHGKRILFIDDLITTGSTAKACVALLKEHGAGQVKILAMGHPSK